MKRTHLKRKKMYNQPPPREMAAGENVGFTSSHCVSICVCDLVHVY
jgi:hypothetical protein